MTAISNPTHQKKLCRNPQPSHYQKNNVLINQPRKPPTTPKFQDNYFSFPLLEPVFKPTTFRFCPNFGSFFGKIFCCMPDTAAKFCQKVAQNLGKIETRWV